MHKFLIIVLTLPLLSACEKAPENQQEISPSSSIAAQSLPDSKRWYTNEQLANGYQLFQANCAACHKPDASGTKEWNKPMADGKYPPPPLNGTAHTWHHSMRVLRRVVNKGGAKLGGWMPAFENQLNKEEIDAVLAWVQSHWSDEIYQVWLSRN
jgi:mono/diheme cytochrome c family protein